MPPTDAARAPPAPTRRAQRSSASVPNAAAANGAAGMAANTSAPDVHSWELRLVQEFCDIGSLRDALNTGRFRAPCSGVAAAHGHGPAAPPPGPLPGQAS